MTTTNLVGDFRLILRGFCVILRVFCAMLGLLEQHHRLQHIRGMYSSTCLGISGGFVSKSFSAFAMFLLQSF
jgi:hypothetical protein